MTAATRLVTASAGIPGRPVALVTGAAGGIGSAIAGRLALSGYAVIAVDLDGDKAAEMFCPGEAGGMVVAADLASADAPAEIVSIACAVGPIAYLVNNAGLNLAQTIYDLESAAWDAVQAINLRAPALLCKALIPSWRAHGSGAIVNIGSRVWQSGAIPAYTASKAGIVGLTRSLAVELGRLNVRANVVAPSYIDTAFTRQDRSAEQISGMRRSALSITPLARLGLPEDIANAVDFLLSDKASFITGEVLHVCGGAQLASQSYSFLRED